MTDINFDAAHVLGALGGVIGGMILALDAEGVLDAAAFADNLRNSRTTDPSVKAINVMLSDVITNALSGASTSQTARVLTIVKP